MRRHVHRPTATLDRLQGDLIAKAQPPKFCKDCDWHDFEQVPQRDRFVYWHYCTFPPLLDVITGKPSNPAKNRNDATLCGREAKHFTPRKKS